MLTVGLGFLVGGIGVWGLTWGLRVLISASGDSSGQEPSKNRNLKILFSVLLLMGQFLLSAYLLKVGSDRGHSAPKMGLGLVGGIFFWVFLGALIAKFRDSKKK